MQELAMRPEIELPHQVLNLVLYAGGVLDQEQKLVSAGKHNL
jgi:hypothetical protein